MGATASRRWPISPKKESLSDPADKTSVVFGLKDKPGALYGALRVFASEKIQIFKVESRPIPGRPWEYLFYLDFIGHAEDAVARKALGHLAEQTDMLRVLGCYPIGE